ncbi:putative Blue (type 1) copper binding protein [Helianthus debilis subsp. tardiflorus]
MLKARVMFHLMLIMIIKGVLMEAAMGEVYNVGDSEGWTILVDTSYATWASSKSFRVVDTLLFRYNPTAHDVMQVNQHGFRSCNITTPWKTYNTGNDSFIIKAPGHYYFICSFPSHCEAGQKLDVRVLKKNYNLTTTPRANVSSMSTTRSRSVATLATDHNHLLRSIAGLSTIYVAVLVGLL